MLFPNAVNIEIKKASTTDIESQYYSFPISVVLTVWSTYKARALQVGSSGNFMGHAIMDDYCPK